MTSDDDGDGKARHQRWWEEILEYRWWWRLCKSIWKNRIKSNNYHGKWRRCPLRLNIFFFSWQRQVTDAGATFTAWMELGDASLTWITCLKKNDDEHQRLDKKQPASSSPNVILLLFRGQVSRLSFSCIFYSVIFKLLPHPLVTLHDWGKKQVRRVTLPCLLLLSSAKRETPSKTIHININHKKRSTGDEKKTATFTLSSLPENNSSIFFFFLSLDPFSDMKDDDSFALTSSCLVSPVLSSHEKSTSSSSQERETFFSLLKHNFWASLFLLLLHS